MITLPWTAQNAPHLVLEVNHACNISCRGCYKQMTGAEKPVEDILRELDLALRERRVQTVSLAGGETTLHSGLVEIVRRIHARGLKTAILTNGLALGDDLLAELKAAGLNLVQLHIDEGQRRPDLPTDPTPADIHALRDRIAGRVARHGLDAGLCVTLYRYPVESVSALVEYVIRSRWIHFLFASHYFDPEAFAGALADGDTTWRPETDNNGVFAELTDTLNLEPFACLRESGRNTPMRSGAPGWLTYLVPVLGHNGQARRLAVRSTRADMLPFRLLRLLNGRYVFYCKPRSGALVAQLIINSLFTGRLVPALRFLAGGLRRHARIGCKRIVFDNGPRIMADGRTECADLCPNATVRDGKLVGICTADIPGVRAVADRQSASPTASVRDRVIGRTRVYCTHCRMRHDATLERAADTIVGRVACPVDPRAVTLSSDADMYLALRARAPIPTDCNETGADAILVSYLDITNQCNFHCPVCYADAGDQAAPRFMSVDEAVRRADRARHGGAWSVTLVGGEPTVHPELEGIIRALRGLNMRVSMASNGVAFARNPALARSLHEAGLAKVNMQFDTFREDVHRALRGNVRIAEKQTAARNIIASGMNLGITSTVTSLNLDEVGDIVRYGLSMGPMLTTFTFRVATLAGRHEGEPGRPVDKEQILRRLFDSHAIPGLGMDDFWPVPHFAPWRMHVHPDCGVCAALELNDGAVRRTSAFIDMAKLWKRMEDCRAGRHWLARNLLPLYTVLAATRHGKRFSLVRSITGMIRRDPRRGLVLLAVADFPREDFCDLQRTGACSAAVLTAEGRVSPCWWYGWENTRS
jgi:MoaA/NifB/PqqE/SkfB family radical SAM enzyme